MREETGQLPPGFRWLLERCSVAYGPVDVKPWSACQRPYWALAVNRPCLALSEVCIGVEVDGEELAQVRNIWVGN